MNPICEFLNANWVSLTIEKCAQELSENGKTVWLRVHIYSKYFFSGPQEIGNIHEHYEGLKKAIFAEPDPNLNLIQQNLVPKLNGSILTYSSWQRNHTVSIFVYMSVKEWTNLRFLILLHFGKYPSFSGDGVVNINIKRLGKNWKSY